MKLKKVLTEARKRRVNYSTDSEQLRNCAGFSIVEICIGLMLAVALAGFAILNMGSILPGMHANKAMYQAVEQLRYARQSAIAQRHNIRLSFVGDDQIRVSRIESSGSLTELSTVSLGYGFEFRKFDSITEDTPDGFGNTSALDFGTATTLTFRSDGMLVDDTGNPANGTIFMGEINHPEVARAVTILGATGRVRSYRWTGTDWVL